MNTKDNWKTTATVTDPERKDFWEKVFGGDQVPIRSFIPSRANLPGHPNALIYELDLGAITDRQRARLIIALAEKFSVSLDEVDASLDEHGVPILADHLMVVSTDRALMANLMDFE